MFVFSLVHSSVLARVLETPVLEPVRWERGGDGKYLSLPWHWLRVHWVMVSVLRGSMYCSDMTDQLF